MKGRVSGAATPERAIAAVEAAAGELKRLRREVWWLRLAIVIFVAVTLTPLHCGKDDSDPPGWFERSGMRVYTDARTGCQYLAPPGNGALTPRLDASSKPTCAAAVPREAGIYIDRGAEVALQPIPTAAEP